MDLSEVYTNYGRFLADRKRRVEADGNEEAADEFKKKAEDAYRAGVQTLNALIKDLQDKAEAFEDSGETLLAFEASKNALKSIYRKGMAFYYWALNYNPDDFNREDYLSRAVSTLDEYVWEAPEDDFFALWAFLYQAMAYTELNQLQDALDLAKQIYNPQTGIDLKQAIELDSQYARLITDLVESAYLQVAKIQLKREDYESVDATVKQLEKEFTEFGFPLSAIGDNARLIQAKALIEGGEADQVAKASEICTDVDKRNPNTTVGWEAKMLLKEIIDTQSRGENSIVPPDVLYAAAEGARAQGKYMEAIRMFMRVFNACKTDQLQEEFTAKTWNAIGQCYNTLKRYLEASIAFEEAFQAANKRTQAELYEKSAMSWYYALMRRHKETRDRFDDTKKRIARDRLVKEGISTDLQFINAQELFGKAVALEGEERVKAMEEALQEFEDLESTSQYYERGIVFQARCFFEMGNFEEAIKKFNFFETFIKSARMPTSKQQRISRENATAEGAFWRAETHLKKQEWDDALKTLDGFEDTYKSQAGFFDAVLYNRILAYLGNENFPAAEKVLQRLGRQVSRFEPPFGFRLLYRRGFQ